MKRLSKLHTKYLDLMARADAAMSRKEALECIRQATKVHEKIQAEGAV